jgi:hypothetical protein
MAAKTSGKPARRRVFLILLLLVSAGVSYLVVAAAGPLSPNFCKQGR